MRLAHAVLVIVDVSGYTAFIKNREVSLLHAEEIITELLDSMIDRAEHPLTLNKLEGDAALFYAEVPPADSAAVQTVIRQVHAFFGAFSARLRDVREARRHCSCEACANIDRLMLKALVHVGEVAIKQVRQFEELAGESVILIHRLLKNTVPTHEYILLTEAAYGSVAHLLSSDGMSIHESVESLEPVRIWWLPPSAACWKTLAG